MLTLKKISAKRDETPEKMLGWRIDICLFKLKYVTDRA